jgi:hypothetical protein
MATVRETRAVKGFTEVCLRGYGSVDIEQTEDETGAEGLEIEAEESIVSQLGSEVRGNRLVLGFRMPWYEWLTYWLTWLLLPNKKILFRVAMRKVEDLEILGSGEIAIGALKTDRCRLSIAGSGRIRVQGFSAGTVSSSITGSGEISCGGNAERHEVHISGSGSVKAGSLLSRETCVRITGSGGVHVNASAELDVAITGSGSVRYLGQPKLSTRITGSGRVSRERE